MNVVIRLQLCHAASHHVVASAITKQIFAYKTQTVSPSPSPSQSQSQRHTHSLLSTGNYLSHHWGIEFQCGRRSRSSNLSAIITIIIIIILASIIIIMMIMTIIKTRVLDLIFFDNPVVVILKHVSATPFLSLSLLSTELK